jgi:RNA polymerase sigma factor (sigma-70 family)
MKKNNSNTNGTYFSSIFEKDEMLLKAFYLTNFSSVRSYVLTNSGTEEEAKDIYQEAFVIAWRKVQNNSFIESYENALSAFIFKIAKYKWLDELRRKKIQPVKSNISGADVAESSEEVIFDETDKLIDLIVEKLEILDERCRNLLTQFYYAGTKIKELAKNNNWTEATAKNNKYRCLEKLRKLTK